MDAVGRKVESQVQFWSLLGPFLVLLSIAVLLFKVSIHWYFPVSALIGIPLCVKWKMKGMAIALCTLLVLSGIGYQNLELDDRYWHVGLALAMAFSFIVMTLSLEEVQGLVAKLQLESQSRLDNFVLLDEQLKAAEQEWTAERERTKAETSALTMEMARAQEEKQTFHKLAQLAKEELIQVRGQHEQLLQDLYYKKQQIAQLHERLEESELALQDFINSDGEKKIGALTDQAAVLEREKEVLKAKVAVSQNEARALQNKLSFLEEEREANRQAKVSLQQQCEQMRQAETQQRQVVQQAQQKIHELKVKLIEEEQLHETLQLKEKELTEQVERLEKQAMQKEEQCKAALQDAKNQLQEQKTYFENQIHGLKRQTNTQGLQQQEAAAQEIKALQEQLQKIRTDLLAAQQSLEFQNQELVQLQHQKEQTQETMHQMHSALREQKERFEEQLHEMQLQAGQRKLPEHQAAEQEALRLHNQNRQLLEELREVKGSLDSKSNGLFVAQQEADHLKAKEAEREKRVSEAVRQLQELEHHKTQLEEVLQKTQTKLHFAEQKLVAFKQNHEKLPYAPGNTRQIEAMYLQLKEQFQEKCQVLDEARRELFVTNEKLLSRLKDEEEERVFGLSATESTLQNELVQLGRQYDLMQQRYQQENDDLAKLIDDLLKELSKAR